MNSTETTTTDEKYEKKTVVNRWDQTLILIGCLLLFVTAVLSGVSIWQGTQRNSRIDHIDRVVVDAKIAAEDAHKAVQAAVASTNTPAAKRQQAAILAALSQIQEIKEIVEELANR